MGKWEYKHVQSTDTRYEHLPDEQALNALGSQG